MPHEELCRFQPTHPAIEVDQEEVTCSMIDKKSLAAFRGLIPGGLPRQCGAGGSFQAREVPGAWAGLICERASSVPSESSKNTHTDLPP
jgi:hypothetical protein